MALLHFRLRRMQSMAVIAVLCPHCHSDHVIKGGKTTAGKQRYRCLNEDCAHRSFVLDPAYPGRLPQVKQQIIDMALNGSGVRDTARVLGVGTRTVSNELKKRGQPRVGQPSASQGVESQRS